ncbi:MAG TPA: biopolymer transporter ExbD [Chitinophagaceae bacterium]|nr:biopolymer transporter ExbD [Chitinophagaceae bacterium]
MAQPADTAARVPRRGAGRLRPGRTLPARRVTRIDMTPMVDLGFLLICFFVVTTTMSEPRRADLFCPKAGPPMKIRASAAVTLLLGADDRLYYYTGDFWQALGAKAIRSLSYSVYARGAGVSGLGAVIRDRQAALAAVGHPPGDLVLVIKPGPGATYRNLSAVLEEVLIHAVKHYALVDPDEREMAFLEACHP